MKKLFLLLYILLLTACSKNIEIEFDRYNGYRYYIALNDNEYASIVVRIDPSHEDVISSIYINDLNVGKKQIDKDIIDCFRSIYNSDASKIEEERVSYLYSENENGYYERIIINFYMEDSSIDLKQLEEYLGLKGALTDNILYYEDELLEYKSFRYQWIIDQGIKESL